MKKIIKLISFLAIICISFFLSSCPNPIGNDLDDGSSKYIIYTNFNQIGTKAIAQKTESQLQDGDPIVGVLFKFTSEGA